MKEETDEELIARYKAVKEEIKEAEKKRDKMTRNRDRQSRWIGCLVFARLTIEDKMRERGINPENH